jgi:hypothetical protein
MCASLSGLAHHSNRRNRLVLDRQYEYRLESLTDAQHERRLRVDVLDRQRCILGQSRVLCGALHADRKLSTSSRPTVAARRRHLAAAIAPHADVLASSSVNADASPDANARAKRSATAVGRAATCQPRPSFCEARLCAMQQLTGVVDGDAEHFRDFRMAVLEDVLEKKYRRSSGESVSSSTRNASVTDSAR